MPKHLTPIERIHDFIAMNSSDFSGHPVPELLCRRSHKVRAAVCHSGYGHSDELWRTCQDHAKGSESDTIPTMLVFPSAEQQLGIVYLVLRL